ncbi:MAG: bifunctional UDP-N-acetylglucosamine diphosphorylase/glucosamine-1-phosphate N-acetyltransferase GlmU [Parvibaculales bacterium]
MSKDIEQIEQNYTAIILAAGKGTRMKSSLPKVLHQIGGLEMLGHIFKTTEKAGLTQALIVISPDQQPVERFIKQQDKSFKAAIQKEQKGTGDAVKAALPYLGDTKRVLIMFGDTPLMRPETLQEMLTASGDLIVLGFEPECPDGYGRVILSPNQQPSQIIEHKDADAETRKTRLCNGGAMVVNREVLETCLARLENNNAQGEYYLPDLVALAVAQGYQTNLVRAAAEDVLGVDSRVGLAKAEAIFQSRQRQAFLEQGVTLTNPESVTFSHDTQIEPDVTIEPHCVFGPKVVIKSGAVIKAFTHCEDAVIGQGAIIGPYARLRPGTQLAENVKIGNFVETKNAKIHKGAKVNHLSYIGDAEIGAAANIGAGTITCNYDGFNKHKTEIGAGAFIGSNTSLIAPVKIGDGAYIGSSTALSDNVEADALAVTRAPLRAIAGWAKKFRARQKSKKD